MNTLRKTIHTTTLLFVLFFSFTANAQRELWGTGRPNSPGIRPGYEEYANMGGWIYKTDVNGENIQIVHQFDTITGNGGWNPTTALIQATDGNLYGVTNTNGHIYKYDLVKDSFELVKPLGIYTQGGVPTISNKLIEIQPGILAGTASNGRIVYAYNIFTDLLYQIAQTPVYYKTSDITHSPYYPGLRNLFKASDGTLYVAQLGGDPNCSLFDGGVSKINPVTNTYSNLFLNCTNSFGPHIFSSDFIEKNGLLYSTAKGGSNQGGVIYSFNPINNVVNVEYNLPSSTAGAYPSSMIEGSNGFFYGTTIKGGDQNSGILYSYNPTNNQFVNLFDFQNGSYNQVSLEINGKLFGTTGTGVFEYDIALDSFRISSHVPSFTNNTNALIEICRKPFYNYSDTTSFSLCEGTPFEINLICSNSESVIWRKDGTIISEFNTSLLNFDAITVSQSGTWQVEFINECGSTFGPDIELTVNPSSPNTIISTISSDSLVEICPSGSVVLSGNNGGVWSTGENTASITVSNPGVYQIINSNACGLYYSNSVTADTLFIPRPVISTNTSSLLCRNDSIEITSSISGTWSTGDTGLSITVPAEPNVPYYMWSQNECRIDTSNVINLEPWMFAPYEANPEITNTTNSYEICLGDSVQLTSNINSNFMNGYSYSWIRFDGTYNYPASGSVPSSKNVPSVYAKQQGSYFLRQQTPCGTNYYSDTIYLAVNQPLTPSIIQPIYPLSNLCEGNTIQIKTSTTGGVWNTGSTSDTLNVQQDGSYYYIQTNACGSVNSNILTYDFMENNVSFTLPNSSICVAGGDTTFVLSGGSPSGGYYSSAGVIGNTFNTSLANSGANTLTYTLGTTSCTFTATATIFLDTIAPETPPIYYQIPGVVASTVVQPGEEVTLCDNQILILATDPWLSGTWNTGETSTALVIPVPTLGEYYFTSSNGCGGVNSEALTVSTATSTSPTFASVGPFCIGTDFTLPAVSNEGIVGIWSPAVDNQITTTYTFTPNAGQCASTTDLTVTVHDPVAVSFDLSTTEFCENDNSFILDNVTPSGGVFSGNGIVQNQFDPSIAGAGTHLITYTVIDGFGCSSSDTTSISVFDSLDTSVILQGATLTAVSGNTYQWLDCDNGSVAINGADSISFTPYHDGNYAVKVTSPEGCTDTSACYAINILGINTLNGFDKLISIYPNPTVGTVYFSEEANIQVSNIIGQNIYNKKNVASLNLSEQPTGVYFIFFTNNKDEIIQRCKIVKE